MHEDDHHQNSYRHGSDQNSSDNESLSDTEVTDPGAPEARVREALKQLRIALDQLDGETHSALCTRRAAEYAETALVLLEGTGVLEELDAVDQEDCDAGEQGYGDGPISSSAGPHPPITDGGVDARSIDHHLAEQIGEDDIWADLDHVAGSTLWEFSASESDFQEAIETRVDEARTHLNQAARLRALEIQDEVLAAEGYHFVDERDLDQEPHRLAGAEPATQPADAPRDENDDPVLSSGGDA